MVCLCLCEVCFSGGFLDVGHVMWERTTEKERGQHWRHTAPHNTHFSFYVICRTLLSLKVDGQVGYLKDPSVFLLPAFLFCCSFASGIKTKEHSESFLDTGICFTMTLPSHYFHHSLFLGYREVGWHGKTRSSDII